MAALQIEDWNKWIYVHIYLEPVCPLFWGLNPPKQGPNFKQNKGPHLGSRYILLSSIEFKIHQTSAPTSNTQKLHTKSWCTSPLRMTALLTWAPLAQALVTRRTRSCNKPVRWFGIPSKELWGKKENHLQIYLGWGYVSFQEGRPKKKHNILIWFTGIRKKKRRLIIITKNHTRSRIIPPIYSK